MKDKNNDLWLIHYVIFIKFIVQSSLFFTSLLLLMYCYTCFYCLGEGRGGEGGGIFANVVTTKDQSKWLSFWYGNEPAWLVQSVTFSLQCQSVCPSSQDNNIRFLIQLCTRTHIYGLTSLALCTDTP